MVPVGSLATLLKLALLAVLLGRVGLAQEVLPVLCYHQIHPRPSSEMVTTPQRFRQQLDYLQRAGYRCLTLEQGQAFLRGFKSKKFPKKPIMLTFDDGYDGVWRYAYPELKRRKMRAVCFLVVSKVGQPKPTPHLTRAQIQEMQRSGVFEFGSHTYDLHVPLPERHAQGRVSLGGLERDLIRSRSLLQDWTGRPCRALAWPYGHYDERLIGVARRAGFTSLYTTDYGPNLPGNGALRIRRIRLSSDFDTVDVLCSKLAGH